jgi:hypothetical protein
VLSGKWCVAHRLRGVRENSSMVDFLCYEKLTMLEFFTRTHLQINISNPHHTD